MAIKRFLVLTKVPIFSKICSENKKATAKMILIVTKVDILPVSLFTIENNIEHSILF